MTPRSHEYLSTFPKNADPQLTFSQIILTLLSFDIPQVESVASCLFDRTLFIILQVHSEQTAASGSFLVTAPNHTKRHDHTQSPDTTKWSGSTLWFIDVPRTPYKWNAVHYLHFVPMDPSSILVGSIARNGLLTIPTRYVPKAITTNGSYMMNKFPRFHLIFHDRNQLRSEWPVDSCTARNPFLLVS